MENFKRIVDACKRQEPNAQRLLYEQYRNYALKLVFRYLYQFDEAMDAVNDGFVKLFRKIDQFDDRDARDPEQLFMGWLRRIMVNTAIDQLRKKSMLPEIGAIPEQTWDIRDESGDADTQLLYKELILQIKKLPPSYRIVFNMYVIDGFTHSEIAEIMGMSIGTSKSSLSRARTILQKYVQKMEDAAAWSI